MNRKQVVNSVAARRSGFTIVEMMMALSISVMVFFAMGMVLNKCFNLWLSSTAQWRLAQTARIARERILTGVDASGLVRTGLLNADRVQSGSDLAYGTIADSGTNSFPRSVGIVGDDLKIKKPDGSQVFAQSINTEEPLVHVDSLAVSVTQDVVTIRYRVTLGAAGRTFTQPHEITTRLVNMGL